MDVHPEVSMHFIPNLFWFESENMVEDFTGSSNI